MSLEVFKYRSDIFSWDGLDKPVHIFSKGENK